MKYTEELHKLRAEEYTESELAEFKSAFFDHESVCLPLTTKNGKVNTALLLSRLLDQIAGVKVLSVSLCIPHKSEFIENCWLVINAEDQQDFNGQIADIAKDKQISRFIYTFKEPNKDSKKICKEIISTEEGFKSNLMRKAKLLIDGGDRFLILRPVKSNK